MKRAFLRILPLFFYVMAGLFFGCDSSIEESTPGVNAFDQTIKVQGDLSAQAEEALNNMNKPQQEEQTTEALNRYEERHSSPSPEPLSGN
jgi:hypothetical protein